LSHWINRRRRLAVAGPAVAGTTLEARQDLPLDAGAPVSAAFAPGVDALEVIVPRFDRHDDLPHQGTSMAAPHVAGLAALICSPGLTNPAAIEAAITQSARDLGDPGHDPQHGVGLLDARATLRELGVAR